MTIARAAAVGSLVVAIIAVGVLMFGGGGGTEYTVRMQTANQLVKGNEVKVGGLAVGEITDIKLSEDNQADIKVTINDDFAPLRRGSSITVRQESLPSVANRYLSLHPGPNNARRDPGRRSASTPTRRPTWSTSTSCSTRSTPRHARACRECCGASARWYVGQSDNLQDTFKYLAPSLGNLSRVMEELARDQKTFESLIVNGAKATGAIAARRDDLAELVTNGTGFARALGQENVALDRTLAALPDVLEQGSDDVPEPALGARRPERAHRRLQAGRSRAWRRSCAGSRTCSGRCGRRSRTCAASSTSPGRDNDSVDLMRDIAGARADLARELEELVAALKKGQDEVEFLRPYAPDISAWITHFSQVPAYYDANGHYARVLPIFNAFRYDEATNELIALAPAERVSRREPARHAVLPGRRDAAGPRRLEPVDRRRQARPRGLRPEREAGRAREAAAR